MESGKYIEIAFGVTKRNRIIELSKLPEAIKYAQENKHELFRSYFVFDENVLLYVKDKKSIASFPGPFNLDRLVIDIDKGKDLDSIVLSKVKDIHLTLEDEFGLHRSQIQTFYSGSGYHIVIPDIFHFGTLADTSIVKNTLLKYFPLGDDIYYGTSLVRVERTVNKKTNRFKVRITPEELFNSTVEEIQSIAQTPREIEQEESFEEIPDHSSKIVTTKVIATITPPELQKFKEAEATRMITCVQKMYNTGPIEGTRHNIMMRMISAYRRSGVPKQAIISMMQQWAPKLPSEQVAKHVADVFDKGYKYGCHDPLMAKFCDSRCQFFAKKNYATSLSNSSDMMSSYKEYLKVLSQGKILDLADLYSMQTFRFLPGEFIIVWGDTGIGKTAWVQNLVTQFKVKTLYISLEVDEALLFRRFIQIANDLSKEEVDNAFQSISDSILGTLSQKIDHVHVCTTPPTLQAIEKTIFEESPQIVVIDTLGRLDVPGKTSTEKTFIIASELKRIAIATRCIIIGVHHISKSAAIDERGVRRHLTLHSGIGSSELEQAADKVIGIEADGGNEVPLRYLTSLKARDEIPFKRIPFNYNWNSFRYEQVKQALSLMEEK